jgi:hypothetical protein
LVDNPPAVDRTHGIAAAVLLPTGKQVTSGISRTRSAQHSSWNFFSPSLVYRYRHEPPLA